MKYHYQSVSSSSVRIELIVEDRNEAYLFTSLAENDLDNPELMDYYWKGLQNYAAGAELTKINFMRFPMVALCSFTLVQQKAQELSIAKQSRQDKAGQQVLNL